MPLSIAQITRQIQRQLSRTNAIPMVNRLSPSAARKVNAADISGHLAAQRLAYEAVYAVRSLLNEGMTETQAAQLLNTYLQDSGVQSFFHRAFVWFGDRTRFVGVNNYFDYLPSQRPLKPNTTVILDVAPIVEGYIADIGYSFAYGLVPGFDAAMAYLKKLRDDLPGRFLSAESGGQIWRDIDADIGMAGFENIHAKYPFSVIAHRVHKSANHWGNLNFINFGWQSYWEFLSRGLFGQLLNSNHEGNLDGLWAIEPHIGTPQFGVKFEEIILVEKNHARWLDPRRKLEL